MQLCQVTALHGRREKQKWTTCRRIKREFQETVDWWPSCGDSCRSASIVHKKRCDVGVNSANMFNALAPAISNDAVSMNSCILPWMHFFKRVSWPDTSDVRGCAKFFCGVSEWREVNLTVSLSSQIQQWEGWWLIKLKNRGDAWRRGVATKIQS